jgi:hypothetical protein
MSDCSSGFRAFTPLSSQTTARPRTAGTSFGSQTQRPADGSRATPPGPLDATNQPQRRGGYTIRRFWCGHSTCVRSSSASPTSADAAERDRHGPLRRALALHGSCRLGILVERLVPVRRRRRRGLGRGRAMAAPATDDADLPISPPTFCGRHRPGRLRPGSGIGTARCQSLAPVVLQVQLASRSRFRRVPPAVALLPGDHHRRLRSGASS